MTDYTYLEASQAIDGLNCDLLDVLCLNLGLDPGVNERICSWHSIIHIYSHKFCDQILSLGADGVPGLASEFPFTDFKFLNDLIIRTVKGWTPTQHDVKYDTYAPHVTLLRVATL